jgi:hypothetical protein
MKYYVRGAVASIHWRIEFIKQVFPIFFNPIGTYPKPVFISNLIGFKSE